MSEKQLLWGQNSFIPPCPFYQLQMDSSYLEHTQLEVVSFRLLDTFTKYMVVVPIQDNLEGDIAAGMIEDLKNGWRTGTTTYAWWCSFEYPLDYLKEKGVAHFGTRGHPNYQRRHNKNIQRYALWKGTGQCIDYNLENEFLLHPLPLYKTTKPLLICTHMFLLCLSCPPSPQCQNIFFGGGGNIYV